MREKMKKKGIKKRFFSVVLVLVMAFSLMLDMSIIVKAESYSPSTSGYGTYNYENSTWHTVWGAAFSVGDVLEAGDSGFPFYLNDNGTEEIYLDNVPVTLNEDRECYINNDVTIDRMEGDKLYLKSIQPHEHAGMTFDKKITSAGGTLSDGNYYLDSNVELGTNLTITGTVNLCLNGHVLKGTGSGSVITVSAGATLNLYDCDTSTTHYFTKADNLWTLAADQSTPTEYSVTGGVITGGGNTNNHGGGVIVNGTFIMNGGNIVGNNVKGTTDKKDGGGVYLASNGSQFTMNAGSIVGNRAFSGNNSWGGGIKINRGTATINGGLIADNYAGYGGGIAASRDKGNVTLNITGGTIEKNSAKYGGGGLYLVRNTTANMSGGKIINNTASHSGEGGGGVYLSSSGFTMSGNAEISGNSCDGKGGGIWGNNAAAIIVLIDNANVSNNTSAGDGGGIYNTGALTVGGSAKVVNNKKGTVTNNTHMVADKTIALSTENPPAAGMQIGVTTATAPTAGNPVKFIEGVNSDNFKYFVPDKEGNMVVYCDGIKDYDINGKELVGCHSSHTANTAWLTLIEVTSVAFDNPPTMLTVGENTTLTVNVDATPEYGKKVIWTSSDDTVATVDETGKVTAVKAGTVTITAKAAYDEEKTATCTITVNPATAESNVIVTCGKNGTASATPSSDVAEGTEVTLTATPNTGYVFDKWEVVSGGVTIDADNKFTMPASDVSIKAYFKQGSAPTPGPKSDDKTSAESTKVYVDFDTNKSEVAYGTVFMHNKDNVRNIFDMKVHSVDARTKANQEFLAASYAKNQGKRARVLLTTGIYSRNKLAAKDIGAKKFLSFINLEKKIMPVYAVCYNQTDKAYYLTGTMNANGTAVFNDFIANEATNITIFVLE